MFKYWLLILTTLPLLGCASLASKTSNDHLISYYDYQLYTPDAQATSLEQFSTSVATADVILIGEWHTHPAIHRFQSDLLTQLYHSSPQLALSMEQFSRDKQDIVDQYLAGEIGEQSLITQGNAWENYQSDYRALVEFSKSNHIDVIAANAPRNIVRCIGRKGEGYLNTLTSHQRSWVAEQINTEDSAYKSKFMASMHHGEPAQTTKQYAAQVTWDETMAESIVSYLATHPQNKVMHIAGKFHVEDGLGIKASILRRAPSLKIIVITPKTELTSTGNGDYQIHVLAPPVRYVKQENRIKAYHSIINQVNQLECE